MKVTIVMSVLVLLACAAVSTAQRCICTFIYAPVCGEDGNTYGNSCLAKCAGVKVVSQGACGSGSQSNYAWG